MNFFCEIITFENQWSGVSKGVAWIAMQHIQVFSTRRGEDEDDSFHGELYSTEQQHGQNEFSFFLRD